MARVVPILIVIALTIYCTVEVAQAQSDRVRFMPKWLWAAVVICLPVVGPFLWLMCGRPRNDGGPPQRPPDDDPDFLSSL